MTMPKHRKLKIYAKYQPRRWGGGVSIPEIRLEGKWLDKLGFKTGQTIIIEQELHKLIIRPGNEQE